MKFWLLSFLAVTLIGGAVYWQVARPVTTSARSPDAALAVAGSRVSWSANHSERGVIALGRIEPADGIVEVSGLVGDRLEELNVATGDQVRSGQPIAQMASRQQRQLEYEAISAQYDEAKSRYQSEEKLAMSRIRVADLAVAEAETVELDIAAQKTKLELSVRNREVAQKDFERLQTVRAQRSNLVTDQESDQQRILLDRAIAEVAANDAMLKKLQQTRDLRLQAARADAESTRASLEHVLTAVPLRSLEKQRDLAAARLKESEIVSPTDGTVLNLLARTGETLRGPLFHLADLSRMVVVAEVYETEIKRVRPGQIARVTSSAFEKPYDEEGLRGIVRRVAQTIVTPELRSLDPLAMADRRVVEVVIDLDQDGVSQASRLCNLQVDVNIIDETAVARP
ncbi:MAG: efflux RND transporter periplasmic adaptor subunit [Planctomycetota bacterium]|nr:efflux RND transporter periplasmic adaptor subunit [Planctomycetota bacterium]